jgi:ADP-ribose pyrophosphatase YjhB (NUDIX family)
MIIFINDVPVRILREDEEPDEEQVNNVLNAEADTITRAKLLHHVLVKNVDEGALDSLLDFLNSNIPTNLLSLQLTVKNYAFTKAYLRSKFKIVKAAGGLIRKKDKFLMIYRLKKWDLPKGKKERGEKYRETARREVEEECNVTVRVGEKICTTWHTYTMNKNAMLKKTRWYLMDVIDDTKMKPSIEEDIEEARWMSPKEVYHALEYSYQSISFVFGQYYEAVKALKSPPQSL